MKCSYSLTRAGIIIRWNDILDGETFSHMGEMNKNIWQRRGNELWCIQNYSGVKCEFVVATERWDRKYPNSKFRILS